MNCPRCRHDNPEASRFCSSCGSPLLVRAGEPLPGAYTPKHLAGRIATSRAALEGERKQVTILFADLQDSLELVAARDPEDARELLDAVVERMMAAVHEFEGTVNQVMGDGIMALFGAPLAHEDHALRACYAALRMLQSIEQYASEMRAAGRPEPRIRVGLNSGDVLVRSISSDLYMDYSAVGHTTHLAARMEQTARPGTALLTAHTLRLVEGHVDVSSLGAVAVKGLTEPVHAYELRAATGVHSRLEAAAARGLTPFIGRQAEMAVLTEALAHARAGRGQIVAIVGEPGVGKSRLIWELVRSGALDGWRILEAQTPPHGKTSPYLPVVALLRSYFRLDPGDDPADTRERVASTLEAGDLARFVSPTLAVLGVPVDDPEWTGLGTEQKRRRTLEAVKHLLTHSALAQPVCLVVEDLHWADPETLAVLDAVVDSVATARLLLVVSYRPEHRHDWGGRVPYREVPVETFAGPEAAALLEAVTGREAELAPLRGMLADRARGNPFFLEESVRYLIETGALAGVPGHLTVVKMPEATHVPDTVHAVLAARVDRLSPEDKRVLQTASVIGKDVPRRLLEAVVDLPASDVAESLVRLQAAQFLHEARLFPDVEYAFRHALTHEVVHGGLVRDRRRAIDARIVEALEAREAAGDTEHADRLAHHALRAELWEKAVSHCRDAGRQALSRFAHRGAATHFEEALRALAQLPPDADASESAVDLRLELRFALLPLGDYRRMAELLTDARHRAEKLGDQRRLGRIACYLCNLLTLRFNFAEAIEHGTEALRIATALDDPGLAAVARAMLALAHYASGEYRRAVDMGVQAAMPEDVRAEGFGIVLPPAVYGPTVASWALAELGEFADARRLADAAVLTAETLTHPHSVIFANLGRGFVLLRQGAVDAAVAVLEHALDIWTTADLPAVLLELAGPLASAYAQAGRAADAIALLERAVAEAVLLRHRLGNALGSGGMAEAFLGAGRVEEARPLAQLYVDMTKMVNSRGTVAWALRLLGEVLARADVLDAHAADGTLEESLALARELGMRPLEARVMLVQARLLKRLGRPEDARRTAVMAAERFTRLDMPGWRAICDREFPGA
jgi:class 3 adenylate cyclase/tetratricopeptide (TPR) repeat protein